MWLQPFKLGGLLSLGYFWPNMYISYNIRPQLINLHPNTPKYTQIHSNTLKYTQIHSNIDSLIIAAQSTSVADLKADNDNDNDNDNDLYYRLINVK